MTAGILTRSAATGDLRFSHVLVRDALYDRLPTQRVDMRNLRAADVIETLRASDLGPHRSEIAHHHIAAGPVADPAVAADYAALAGRAALDSLAHEEAIRLFGAALELIERGVRMTTLDSTCCSRSAKPKFEPETCRPRRQRSEAPRRSRADCTVGRRSRVPCSGMAVVSYGFVPAPIPCWSTC